ncbi:PREDICTED: serpin B13 isoform X1 [Rhinopithecus bieti]|uniref:serpin B13 isoform X1 n=1 Tax=Rhinopithecus bieti TaxID=61621 RepID=UPI00083C1844|nr:PREDICTED: serpin B13 isoform X1 [Rhinopithecus bieti]
MDTLGTISTRFGLDLFKELKKTNDGNIFFSPVGLLTAIGMLLLGTRGASASQLEEVFHSEKGMRSSRTKAEENKVVRIKAEENKVVRIKAEGKEIEKTEAIHQQFQKFLTEISKLTNDYELNIANRLFGEKTYLFLQKYLDYVEKYYHASLEPVDFVNAADESRKKINSWVESKTNERIKDLFPDGSISSSTKLVLVNTVYFKGQWDREFKKENTKEEKFWMNKSTSKSVQMMTQSHSFSFTFLEDLQAKILGIPYKNNDLSMFVLLPNDIDGLEKIIDKISPEKLVEWTSPGHMEERRVNLHLPRFEVEDSYDLEAVLAAMGMSDAFSEHKADYSGMSSLSGLQAQKFLHSSFVAVTEEGTEAAAATGIGFTVTSAPGHENVHCNHPFLFFIRHNESNSILFFGRFSSP